MAVYILNQPKEFDFVVRIGWAASDQNFVPARIPTYGCNVCCSLGNFVANSAKISHLRDSRFGMLLSQQKVDDTGAAGLVCEPQNFYIKKLRDCAQKSVLALYKEGVLPVLSKSRQYGCGHCRASIEIYYVLRSTQ